MSVFPCRKEELAEMRKKKNVDGCIRSRLHKGIKDAFSRFKTLYEQEMIVMDALRDV